MRRGSGRGWVEHGGRVRHGGANGTDLPGSETDGGSSGSASSGSGSSGSGGSGESTRLGFERLSGLRVEREVDGIRKLGKRGGEWKLAELGKLGVERQLG